MLPFSRSQSPSSGRLDCPIVPTSKSKITSTSKQNKNVFLSDSLAGFGTKSPAERQVYITMMFHMLRYRMDRNAGDKSQSRFNAVKSDIAKTLISSGLTFDTDPQSLAEDALRFVINRYHWHLAKDIPKHFETLLDEFIIKMDSQDMAYFVSLFFPQQSTATKDEQLKEFAKADALLSKYNLRPMGKLWDMFSKVASYDIAKELSQSKVTSHFDQLTMFAGGPTKLNKCYQDILGDHLIETHLNTYLQNRYGISYVETPTTGSARFTISNRDLLVRSLFVNSKGQLGGKNSEYTRVTLIIKSLKALKPDSGLAEELALFLKHQIEHLPIESQDGFRASQDSEEYVEYLIPVSVPQQTPSHSQQMCQTRVWGGFFNLPFNTELPIRLALNEWLKSAGVEMSSTHRSPHAERHQHRMTASTRRVSEHSDDVRRTDEDRTSGEVRDRGGIASSSAALLSAAPTPCASSARTDVRESDLALEGSDFVTLEGRRSVTLPPHDAHFPVEGRIMTLNIAQKVQVAEVFDAWVNRFSHNQRMVDNLHRLAEIYGLPMTSRGEVIAAPLAVEPRRRAAEVFARYTRDAKIPPSVTLMGAPGRLVVSRPRRESERPVEGLKGARCSSVHGESVRVAHAAPALVRGQGVRHLRSELSGMPIELRAQTTTAAILECEAEGVNPVTLGALNFANAFGQGGGWLRGATAQEEMAFGFNSSAPIVWALEIIERGQAFTTPSGNVLYSKDMTALISGDDGEVFVSPADELQFVTSHPSARYREIRAALADRRSRTPHLVDYTRAELYQARMTIRAIIRSAYNAGIEVPVFGAIGCGAFKHKPERIALLFKEELELFVRHYRKSGGGSSDDTGTPFRRVIFAIPADVDAQNLAAFRTTLFA